MTRLLVALLLLSGCTATVATNGRVTVAVGSREWARRTCEQAMSQVQLDMVRIARATVRGCHFVICPEGDVECLAHEVRHLTDPDWRHTP